MRATWLAVFGVLSACATLAASAGEAEPPRMPPLPAAERAVALLGQGQARGAIELLKPIVADAPDDESVHLALARAYLADGNGFWGLRVLHGFLDGHPEACDARALLAWVHLGQANAEAATQVLSASGCEAPGETHARLVILRAHLAAQTGDTEKARSLVRIARGESRLFEEDRRLLLGVAETLNPGRLPVLSGKVDLAAGWTSNGLSGSPTDPAAGKQSAPSAVEQLELQLRVVLPAGPWIRPSLDASLRAHQLNADRVEGLSYRQPTLRPGILFGRTHPRLLVAFGYDLLQLAGGDRYSPGPTWFSEGRRGEFEIEIGPRLFVFGAAGHRRYREIGRSQLEFELGAMGVFPVGERARVVAGAMVRARDARNDAYDNVGATLSAHGQVGLPKGFELRPSATLSADRYPRSAGYFDPATPGARRDWLARLAAVGWSPDFHRIRFGVEVGYGVRASTAGGYGFQEFRALARLAWTFDSDTWGTTIGARHRVPMPFGEADALALDQLRIRDLMKQDESMRRGSSCLK